LRNFYLGNAQFVKNQPTVKKILEVGFSGVIAGTLLSVRPDIEVVSVTTGAKSSTLQEQQSICKLFPGRHQLLLGEYSYVLPKIDEQWDLIYVNTDSKVAEKFCQELKTSNFISSSSPLNTNVQHP
jgi:hypothetical protein